MVSQASKVLNINKMSATERINPLFSVINNQTNNFCISPAGVVDLGGMDVDVRGDRFVHKRPETQPKV